VPSAATNLGFVDLNRPWQLQIRKYPGLHVKLVSSSKQSEHLLQGCPSTAHLARHLRGGIANPHGQREVKQHKIVAVNRSALCDASAIVANRAHPHITQVVPLGDNQSHAAVAKAAPSTGVDEACLCEVINHIDCRLTHIHFCMRPFTGSKYWTNV
jgi:hypothetical protein